MTEKRKIRWWGAGCELENYKFSIKLCAPCCRLARMHSERKEEEEGEEAFIKRQRTLRFYIKRENWKISRRANAYANTIRSCTEQVDCTY